MPLILIRGGYLNVNSISDGTVFLNGFPFLEVKVPLIPGANENSRGIIQGHVNLSFSYARNYLSS